VLKALGTKVIVEAHPEKERKVGGVTLIMPEKANGYRANHFAIYDQQFQIGTVISVGPRVVYPLKEGQTVYFKKFIGVPIPDTDYQVMEQGSILGIYE
jgi:co-chaperonin GroES (HSP10)